MNFYYFYLPIKQSFSYLDFIQRLVNGNTVVAKKCCLFFNIWMTKLKLYHWKLLAHFFATSVYNLLWEHYQTYLGVRDLKNY